MAKGKRVFELTYPNAAGIDVGAASHFVAVPPDRDDEPVREFSSFTEDLYLLADWLVACGVDTVAMESTGVYWLPLYELLESRGFTVYLVNARHVKNVSGRKSDVLDCQWLQQLMSFGLLAGAFRPQGDLCALRSVARQREMLLNYQTRHVQHMKALTQMNLQLGQVISDVVGETGQKIIRAILAGERDGQALAKLKNVRIRASEEDIAKALQGSWREEHLFALKQAVALYDAYAEQLSECDRQLEKMLAALARHEGQPGPPKRRGGRAKNAPQCDMHTYLFQLCGVDLTRIDGIDVTPAFKVLAEVGADLSRFKSAKHFASWLGLCPGTKIAGGKLLSGASKRTANRAAQALKMAAANLRTSQSALGAYYRRLCARMDRPRAITACAHKLARLIYTLLTKGEEYVDQGQAQYEERYRQRVIRNLTRKAEKLGLQLIPAPKAA